MDKVKAFFVSAVLLCLFASVSLAQKSYALRLKLTSLDTTQRVACYDLQVSNRGNESWYLGNSNIFVFYDFSVVDFRPDLSCLLLDDLIYDINDLDRNSNKVDNSGFPLPYESTLGTIRAGFSTNVQGALMDTMGTWVSTVKLCFDLLMDDITSEETCLQANFINEEIESLLPVRDIVQEYDPNVFISDIPRDTAFDLIPDRTLNTCFIIEENTPALCSDGIDNDEDGLLDCDDTGACAPEIPNFNITGPGGCDGAPSLIRVNGVTGDVMYSIDDGLSFQADSIFTGLDAGQYEVLIVKNGVMSCALVSPITLEQKECKEDSDSLCSDGIDNDEDGLTDCEDTDCHYGVEAVTSVDPDQCPDLNNGIITVDFSLAQYEISIDSGVTYVAANELSDLAPGEYNLTIHNITTGCAFPYMANPIILVAEECPDEAGFCADGIDNDFDGLVDCADTDCADFNLCQDFSEYYIPTAINPYSDMNASFGVYAHDQSNLIVESFEIFDRWGGVVHHVTNRSVNDISHRWTGYHDNQLVPNGIYIYKMIIDQNGLKNELDGTVTVLY